MNTSSIENQAASLTRRLLVLGNQVMSLAREMAHSVPSAEAGVTAQNDPEALALDSDLWFLLAQEFYSERRRRKEFLPADLFGEPAWDIMLDLYVAAKLDKRIAVTSACLGADVPVTTALRWLHLLEVKGLIERYDDDRDQRRTFVRLTTQGYASMTRYFATNRATLMSEDTQMRHKNRLASEKIDFNLDLIDHSRKAI